MGENKGFLEAVRCCSHHRRRGNFDYFGIDYLNALIIVIKLEVAFSFLLGRMEVGGGAGRRGGGKGGGGQARAGLGSDLRVRTVVFMRGSPISGISHIDCIFRRVRGITVQEMGKQRKSPFDTSYFLPSHFPQKLLFPLFPSPFLSLPLSPSPRSSFPPRGLFSVDAIIIFLTSSSQRMFHLDDDSGAQQATDPFECDPPVLPKHPQAQSGEGLQVMYYEQYKKIYLTSYKLWLQGKKQESKHRFTSERIGQIEAQLTAFNRRKRTEEMEESFEAPPQVEKKRSYKRNRRTAEEIERKFQCPYQFCDRCYGSDGSLQQHLKLKHPELYRSANSEEYQYD